MVDILATDLIGRSCHFHHASNNKNKKGAVSTGEKMQPHFYFDEMIFFIQKLTTRLQHD
jgi:hypothetical protein